MKPIYKKKVFAKGGNNKSYPVNNKFWGYENNDYTTDYKKDVDNIITNNWEAAKKYMTDNNVTYAQTPEGFRSAAFDKKVGTVHEYIKDLSNKSVPNINVVAPKKSIYTHTTDRNFYDSGQFSPEEKALYNPETLTRNITKEEFDKAMKTNYPVTNSIGAGYRENIQYAKGGNNIKPKYFAGGNAISTGLGAAAGIASVIPGGQIIGAGLGALGSIVGVFNNNDKEKEAIAKQNALVAAQEQQQLNQLVDTEKINQRNYAIDTPKSSFYAKGGNTKLKIDINKSDNTRVAPSKIESYTAPNTTSEFILNPKTGKQEYNPNAKMGLEIVSPEFQILTGMGVLNKPAASTIDLFKGTPEELAKRAMQRNIKHVGNKVLQLVNPLFKNGGNMKPKYATGGQALQAVAEDGVIVNGKSHEQGGVNYGDIEVEKGETIKKEADGDFVFSTEFKPDGKNDAGAISAQLFETKQLLQQKSGLAATEINDGRKALRISPSRIDSNTKGREVTRNQFKQKAIEQQIQQTDDKLEQLKQQQIQWGQEQGIYDEEGNNIVADQPLDQQEQPIAAKGGNFKPQFEGGGFVNGMWVANKDKFKPKGNSILDKKNISSDNTNDVINPQVNFDNKFNPTFTGFGKTSNTNFRDTSKDKVMTNNTPKPEVSIKKPFNVSAGLDVASTLVNYASNLQTSRNMAKLQTPGYIPIKAIETRRLNMDADRLEATNQEQNYGDWAERNIANPQQAAIIKQSARNQTQQQLGRITQTENTANTQIDDTNASRNLQVQQINNAGVQDYNQRVMDKSISDIQNVSNTNAVLLKDIRQGITNQETRDNENRMYELYKLQYKNTPGVARDLGNAMEGTQLTLDQWKKLQANNKPIGRKGGRIKPKYITK